MEPTIRCTVCGEVKQFEHFYATRAGKHGKQAHCKSCDKRKQKAYRERIGPAVWKKRYDDWRQNNLEHLATQNRALTWKIKSLVIQHYSDGKCACCGETNQIFLCIDHINNDGSDDRKMNGYGTKFYRFLITSGFPTGYQVLCMNCNHGKELNGGICPHVDFSQEPRGRHYWMSRRKKTSEFS